MTSIPISTLEHCFIRNQEKQKLFWVGFVTLFSQAQNFMQLSPVGSKNTKFIRKMRLLFLQQ